jgi:peptidyl-dipeptidase Dcp
VTTKIFNLIVDSSFNKSFIFLKLIFLRGDSAMTNPLLQWENGFETFDDCVPFDRLESSHFLPALETAFHKAVTQIVSLEKDPQDPCFEKIIVPLESCSHEFLFISTLFHNLLVALHSDELQALANPIAALSTELSSRIFLSEPIFRKVQNLWNQKDSLNS